ncbi:MAG: hypothetical protein H0X46_03790 [Bacteroidetes bacterium]|nr:hypothetical protein [Bacteroidota bacterium]
MKQFLFSLTLFVSLLSVSVVTAKERLDEPLQDVDKSIVIDRIGNSDIEVTLPSVIFTFKETNVKLRFVNPTHTKLLVNSSKLDLIVNGQNMSLEFVNGEASFKHKFDQSKTLSIFIEDFSYSNTVTAYPLWAFLVPIGFIILWLIRRMMKK